MLALLMELHQYDLKQKHDSLGQSQIEQKYECIFFLMNCKYQDKQE